MQVTVLQARHKTGNASCKMNPFISQNLSVKCQHVEPLARRENCSWSQQRAHNKLLPLAKVRVKQRKLVSVQISEKFDLIWFTPAVVRLKQGWYQMLQKLTIRENPNFKAEDDDLPEKDVKGTYLNRNVVWLCSTTGEYNLFWISTNQVCYLLKKEKWVDKMWDK